MKILILSVKMPFPPNDGGAVATLNIAKGLAETGNEVTLMCLNTTKHYFPVDDLPVKLRKMIRFICINHDTSINYTLAFLNLIFSGKPYNALRFFSSLFKKELSEILTKEKFDIVQMEGPYLGWYITLIKSLSEAKISLRAHNLESEIWERKASNESNIIRKFYFSVLAARIKKFEEETLMLSDILVPVSKEVAGHFLNVKNNIPSLVSPTGFFIDEYPSSITSYPRNLFYLGSLEWIPNQEGLCWFLDKVWKNNVFNSVLHVAGRNAPGWLNEKLRNCPGVVFHGEVDNAIEFMREFDVLISPLLSGSGIRIKILEAMLLGKIVIATPLSASGIPAEEGESILFAESDSEFTSKIQSLFEKPASFIHIGAKARKLIIENFNNLALCKQLTGFYRYNLK